LRRWVNQAQFAAPGRGEYTESQEIRALEAENKWLRGERFFCARRRNSSRGSPARTIADLSGFNSVRRARVVRTTVLGKDGRAPVTCSTVTSPPRRLAQPFALVVDSHAHSGSRNPNGGRPERSVRVLVRRHRHSVGHQPTGPGQDLQRDGGPIQTYACRRDGVPHSLLAQWTTDAECTAAQSRSDL